MDEQLELNSSKEDGEAYKLDSRLSIVENNISGIQGDIESLRNSIKIDVKSLEQTLNANNILMAKLDGIEKGRLQLLLIASNAISWAIGYFQDRILGLFK